MVWMAEEKWIRVQPWSVLPNVNVNTYDRKNTAFSFTVIGKSVISVEEL